MDNLKPYRMGQCLQKLCLLLVLGFHVLTSIVYNIIIFKCSNLSTLSF